MQNFWKHRKINYGSNIGTLTSLNNIEWSFNINQQKRWLPSHIYMYYIICVCIISYIIHIYSVGLYDAGPFMHKYFSVNTVHLFSVPYVFIMSIFSCFILRMQYIYVYIACNKNVLTCLCRWWGFWSVVGY